MTLRTRLTLALLLTAATSIAVVGVVARVATLQGFDDVVVERAARGFQREVLEYRRAWGSWEAAREAESFGDFARRSFPEFFSGGTSDPGGAVRPGAGRGDGGGPPSPRARRGPTPDGDAGRGAQGGRPSTGEGRPPRTLDGAGRPGAGPSDGRTFLGAEPPPFGVADLDGVAVLPLAGWEVGERIADSYMESAIPIREGGEQIAWAVPRSRPILTEFEESYVSAIERAWLISMGVAALLATLLGVAVSIQLTRPLRELQTAMEAMREGRLDQQVPVTTRGEIGELADGFNRMSRRLHETVGELEASRRELDARARAMTELSRTDSLTELPNRRAFDERAGGLLAQARRYGRPTSVALLDIDHFKRVNDQLSHQAGDLVLRGTADLLRRELREADLVARWGGEEFVIAFPETDLAAARALVERLRSAIESASWPDVHDGLKVTISVGVAEAGPEDSLSDLVARADERLYAAKNAGRNRVES